MIHMGVADEDMADPQQFAPWQCCDVSNIEKQGTPFEHDIRVHHRIAERTIDQPAVNDRAHHAHPRTWQR
jgi:hypothetical protein